MTPSPVSQRPPRQHGKAGRPSTASAAQMQPEPPGKRQVTAEMQPQPTEQRPRQGPLFNIESASTGSTGSCSPHPPLAENLAATAAAVTAITFLGPGLGAANPEPLSTPPDLATALLPSLQQQPQLQQPQLQQPPQVQLHVLPDALLGCIIGHLSARSIRAAAIATRAYGNNRLVMLHAVQCAAERLECWPWPLLPGQHEEWYSLRHLFYAEICKSTVEISFAERALDPGWPVVSRDTEAWHVVSELLRRPGYHYCVAKTAETEDFPGLQDPRSRLTVGPSVEAISLRNHCLIDRDEGIAIKGIYSIAQQVRITGEGSSYLVSLVPGGQEIDPLFFDIVDLPDDTHVRTVACDIELEYHKPHRGGRGRGTTIRWLLRYPSAV